MNNNLIKTKEIMPNKIIKEFLEAENLFKKLEINKTIVIFGSARILSPEEAKKKLETAEEIFNKDINNKKNKKFLQKAKNEEEISIYYQKASDLAFKFANWSKKFESKDKYYICSGGGPGIMEAANKGAFEAKEKTIGLNIKLPFEQGFNKYLNENTAMNFNYFFMRKLWFSCKAKAFIVFPGGFGTMDELFEILTLIQTQKMKSIPFVFFGKEFFNTLLNLDILEKYRLISDTDKNLFLITDDIEEAFNYVIERL